MITFLTLTENLKSTAHFIFEQMQMRMRKKTLQKIPRPENCFTSVTNHCTNVDRQVTMRELAESLQHLQRILGLCGETGRAEWQADRLVVGAMHRRTGNTQTRASLCNVCVELLIAAFMLP